MAQAYVDRIRTLELEELHGAVVGLRREVIVADLNDHDIGIFDSALKVANVPEANSTPIDYPNLILVERKCRLAPESNTAVEIECIYRAKADADYGWVWKCTSVLNSVTTQVDNYGLPITVAHTYPPDDPDFADATVVTGADCTVTAPAIEVTGTGVLETNNPLALAFAWTNALNKTTWANGPSGHWCCVNVEHKPHDLGVTPHKHLFTFTFQYRAYPWLPKVWFIDQRTGRPPVGLVEGVGTKYVNLYKWQEYNSLFPNP